MELRHRGAEGRVPPEDPQRRPALLDRLLRARRRHRPRLADDQGGARRRRVGHQRLRRCGPASSSTPTTCGWRPAPTPTPPSTRASRCSSCRRTSTGFSWTPVPHVERRNDEPDVLRGRAGARRRRSSASSTAGWRLITNQLNHERVALCSPAGVQTSLAEIRAWAQETKLPDGRRVIDQEWVQVEPGPGPRQGRVPQADQLEDRVGRRQGRQPGRRLGHQGVRHRVRHRGVPPADGGARRGGVRAQPARPAPSSQGRVERAYRAALILTFGGGTNEVQRDIIAMVGLGMPQAPRR